MRNRLCAVLAVVALFGAACGDDDDEAATGTTDTTEVAAGGAALETYCEDSLAADTVPEPEIDFATATEEEQKEAAKKFVNEDLKPILDRLKESVPAEIDEPAQVLFAAADKVGEDGDFEALESPEFKEAEAEVHAYDLANCGWEKVDANATEYAFEGIPSTLEAGVTSFDLRNTGKELHEIAVLKKKDGVTESFDDIIKLDQAEGEKKVDVIASAFAAQGEADYAVAELEAGEYVAVCFIPVGTTGQGPPPEGAPPHAAQGMKVEFKVT